MDDFGDDEWTQTGVRRDLQCARPCRHTCTRPASHHGRDHHAITAELIRAPAVAGKAGTTGGVRVTSEPWGGDQSHARAISIAASTEANNWTQATSNFSTPSASSFAVTAVRSMPAAVKAAITAAESA